MPAPATRERTVLEKADLIKMARTPMPFGRYQGRLLMDLPEAYLLWFQQRGFPEGEIGRLLQLTLELKRHGLTYLLRPLRPNPAQERDA